VLSVDADVCRLEISGDVFVAGIAFSCLVRPAPGDVVMAATHDSGESHVIAVIERPGGQDLCITLPADAVVSAPQGSIRVCADRDVTLASNDRLNLFSSRAVHKSREAVVDFDDTVAVGDRLQASYQAVHLVSRLISTVSRQVIKKAKSYIRRTEDCDQVESGQMTRKTEGLYTMDSKHTVMVSKKETKIDGERIFMG
jgi:hypothetical protein